MSELFDAVDALIAGQSPLPAPAERERLRKAHGLTQDQVAQALKVRRPTVVSWESGKTEPRSPQREAYARLLEQLSELYPANTTAPVQDAAVPGTFTRPAASAQQSAGPAENPPAADPAPDTAAKAAEHRAPQRPARLSRAEVWAGPSMTARRPAARPAAARPAPAAVAFDPQFQNGPLAVVDVVDGQVLAYGVGGLILDVPAKSIPSLVDWTLTEAKLGAPKLSGPGKDADPLIVLTEAACERYGLPPHLTSEERQSGRLPEDHKVIKQLTRAEWQLTKRGFGPWARIYRPAKGSERMCVQLCIPSWEALDTRHWGEAAQLPPAELARLLGTYATRVMTPRGSTAVTGLELMTALHPPTRASEPDETGKRHSEHNPGSLGKDAVDCAPCEAPDGHPLLKDLPRFHRRTPAEVLMEEAYDWARPLTDDECLKRHLVGIDVNMAFAAGANGTIVGLGAPTHVNNPRFDPKLPGAWLVDLSHVDVSRVLVAKQWQQFDGDLLPSPFTPRGERPEGPAWYATPTVAYAVELGYDVAPAEAYVRYDNGRYLDGWYNRLRDAYVATMADVGVTADLPPEEFLTLMDGHKQVDPQLTIVLSAVKATVKGGIGKLRERPRGEGWKPGEPWRALSRPTWRPDIRAAVISRTRINMHRKVLKHALATGQYPVAILSDCAVYAADGPTPLDFVPYQDGKPLPGGWRLGVSPGMVKHEGTQTTLWGEGAREQYGPELNLARYIKDGNVTSKDDGE
ncbi:helix-turn-helix transcriptional regulator [Streptomyces sp. 21So2-11]|uniref:telomere-associated protein Tap n=1 Tax=Streptomyces sp. 21So2-11 TaxID=3144408 RepID=UPI003218EACA